MKVDKVKRSPVYPAGTRWEAKPDERLYESQVTAMIRKMLQSPELKEDQEWAWQRWRSGDNAIKRD
jgi:hypothetical protein